MAAKIENGDLITCPICFEQFTSPKYLPCLHTFCHLCLKSYITTQMGGAGKKSQQFQCPVCRQSVTITDQTLSSEKIADTLPGNHLIASLIERSKGSAKGQLGKLCDPCGRDNQELVATYWCTLCSEGLCENCTTSHKRLNQSKHVLIPVGDMEKSANLLDVDEPCMKHTGKVCEVYCMDHKEMCCIICLATQHRKCEHIRTFEEMVNESEESEAMKQFTNNLREIDEKIDELRIKTEENIHHLDNKHEEISRNVSSAIKQAKDKLDHLQSKFELNFQQRHKEEVVRLTDRKERIEIFQNIVKKGVKLLEVVREHGSPKQLFITKTKLRMQLKDHMASLGKDLKDIRYVDYTLKLNDILTPVNQSVASVAEVEIQPTTSGLSKHLGDIIDAVNRLDEEESRKDMQITREPIDIQELKVTKMGTIRAAKDIPGGTYLRDGRIVFCNYSDKKLQAYDKAAKYLFETPTLYHRPADACCISDNEILVSFLCQSYIKSYEITQNTFKEKTTMQCKCYPWGLAATTDSIIVGYEKEVDILSLDGKFIKTLSPRKGDGMSYVAVSQTGNVYYIDGDDVVCKSLDGREISRFSHPELKRLFGIAVDKYGNVYVSGYGSNNVCVFSPDGRNSKILIEDIKYPCQIEFNPDGTVFFVTSNKGGQLYTSPQLA